jgi:DNA-binding response OmpR family regulator
MKALIIDDEVDLCLLLKSYLQRKGYQVSLAHSLDEGLKKIAEHTPQLLFLDNNLPDGIGWEEAPSIAGSFPTMYQYLISAYHPQVPDMPAGAKFTVLEKPISFADLESEIMPVAPAANNESV